ncbi:MAG: hypothetical protein HQ566_02490 [Candidatus Omnitrophica bacterium]|nr:hypothetical protein [Candidatus Omnitrophota bacterium]
MTGMTPEKKLLDLIKQAQGKLRFKKDLKVFTKINGILIGLIILVLAIFLVDVFTFNYKMPEIDVGLGLDLPEGKDAAEALPDAFEFDEDVYEYEEKSAVSKKDLAEDLSLLGIIAGDKDQAVIEDKAASKTYFLYRGDSFGEFTLSDIKESAVILEYKGEEIELKI